MTIVGMRTDRSKSQTVWSDNDDGLQKSCSLLGCGFETLPVGRIDLQGGLQSWRAASSDPAALLISDTRSNVIRS